MHKSPHNTPFLLLGTTSEGESITLTGQEFSRFKWVQGISGSGKSTLLAWIMLSLLRLNTIVVLIDPHGDLARLILSLLISSDYFHNPKSFERLHFIDFARKDAAPAFNVLHQEHLDNYKVASNILEAIHRAFPTSSGTTAALDNTIIYAAFVLAENHVPITQLQRFLLDKAYRNMLLAKIKDQQILQFFDFKFSDKVSSQLIDSTMRRLDLLTFSPTLRMSLGQTNNILSFRNLWEKGISCLISLAGMNENEKRLIGCLLLVSIEQHFLSRLELPPEKRSTVHLLVDEAPLFVAQSETAFTTILEQCRKAGAVLTFANQTLNQLSKGMLGSLQQALPIMMKAGSSDSSELASRFYRPPIEKKPTLFDVLSFSPAPTSDLFATIRNMQEARMLFEHLQRQEAIVMLPNRAVKITTPTIPVKIDQKKLEEIEQEYARRLLTPLSQMGTATTVPDSDIVSSSDTLAKRRIPHSSSTLTPFQTFVGAAGTDEELQVMFSLYGYLTVSQVAKVLGKSENTARNKLKKLVDAGVLEMQHVTRTTPSGKTPTVFSLKKGVRKHEFLAHALATSELLITTALLPSVAPDVTILDLQSDLTLHSSPIKLANGNVLIPDGYVRLCSSAYEYVIYFECDRNTEFQKEKIVTKLNNYKQLATHSPCMLVAFCVVEGGDLRVKTLRKWAADIVPEPYRETFLFAALDLTSALTPATVFLTSIWQAIGEGTPVMLIER